MKLETIVKEFKECSDAFMKFQDSFVFSKLSEIITKLKIFEQEYQSLQQELKEAKENPRDEYHTMKELYEHRQMLFVALMCSNLNLSWKSKKHNDGFSYSGWFIAGMNLDTGTITYHLSEDKWALLPEIKELEQAPKWDGHTSNDVLDRLKSWLPYMMSNFDTVDTSAKYLTLKNKVLKAEIKKLRELLDETIKVIQCGHELFKDAEWCGEEHEKVNLTVSLLNINIEKVLKQYAELLEEKKES